MSSFTPKPFHVFTIESFLKQEAMIPESKIIWNSIRGLGSSPPDPENEDLIQVASQAINTVSCRDVRKNVRASLRMGFELSQQRLKVLYVNSYAGMALLQESMKAELEALELPTVSLDAPKQEESFSGSILPLPHGEKLSSFRLIDSPIGQWEWNVNAIRKEIETHATNILILNSFEFAALNHRQKQKLAHDLIALQIDYYLTVILFTQEVKRDMEPGLQCRGPLGILTSLAAIVSKVEWPKPQIKAKKKCFHEFSIDNDNIIGSATSGKSFSKEYNLDYGDYTEDPWKGEESRTGAELAPYAKHPLLRQFYLDHAEEGYLKGYQPTEWGILEREKDRILRLKEKEAAR